MPKSTRTQKILYIAEHPELLTLSRVQFANALKAAGLVAQSTSPIDLRQKEMCEDAKSIIAARDHQ